jgi:hypothetical protein
MEHWMGSNVPPWKSDYEGARNFHQDLVVSAPMLVPEKYELMRRYLVFSWLTAIINS